jgi:hypothetical protein
MPARHTSLQNDLLPNSRFEPAALVDERGCRRDIRSNGRIVFPKGFALFETGLAEETSFLRSVRVYCGPQFHRRSVAQVKSGPDVFADALVLLRRTDEARRCNFPDSLSPIQNSFRPSTAPGRGRRARAVPPGSRVCPAAGGLERCPDGYRSAKSQGKSKSAKSRKLPSHNEFCNFTADCAGHAFTPDSSRYLNCPSNLIGHDDPNKPANGRTDNGTPLRLDRSRARNRAANNQKRE